MIKTKNIKGFSLVELIVYIAIASMVLVTVVNVAWSIMISNSNTQGKRDTYFNARQVMQQMQTKIREADDVITGSSTFGSHPGALTLDYPAGNTDVVFDTYTKSVTIGGQSTTIRKLQMKVGLNDYVDLTTDKVNVTNFVLTNLTRGTEPPNIKIELTIQKANPGNDPNYDASIAVETAISLRH